MSKKKNQVNYEDWLSEQLKDPEFALAYLNEALVDEDERVFLLALKDVMSAQGGSVAAIAKEAQLNRQNLYRMLSKKGNPRWSSLTTLFDTLGYQIHLSQKKIVV